MSAADVTPTAVPAPNRAAELDVAFCCDCTGSMSAYLKSAQENIRKISAEIHDKAQNCSVRFALVKYRDHPPQDSSFITEVFAFTSKIEIMKQNVDTMVASGGGDGPEAVTAALHEVNELEWRPNAVKICVLIADAPPHGLGESGDGFPQGCPLGYDPIVICRQLAAKGVVVYAVGVEPVLSTSYKFARDFMMSVARITEGKFLPLGRADMLSQVIVSGAMEGVNLTAVWEQLEHEVKEAAAKNNEVIDERELVKRTEERLQVTEAKVHHVAMENPYEAGYDLANCLAFEQATSLATAMPAMRSSINAHAPQAASAFNWGSQQAQCKEASMELEQCARRGAQVKKSRGLY